MPEERPSEYHYKLLGLNPDANFRSVCRAYNMLWARCEPNRFPAGSPERQAARQIRQRLNASFRSLGGTPHEEADEAGIILLRPSSAPAVVSEELLRPAAENVSVPSNELLRPHE